MSRISPAERSRYATIGPSAVAATLVEQHSHTRESMSVSDWKRCAISNDANRSCMSPSSPCVARPSSHTTPMPLWNGNSVANPCCDVVLSVFGGFGVVHVFPSPENATRRSYASGSGPLSISQAAAYPSGVTRTDGTSAEFTISLSLAMTVIGVDQPVAVRSANLNVAVLPCRSTQLSATRSPAVVICGTELFAPAGDVTASTLSAAGDCAPTLNAQMTRQPDAAIHVFFMCDPSPVPS